MKKKAVNKLCELKKRILRIQSSSVQNIATTKEMKGWRTKLVKNISDISNKESFERKHVEVKIKNKLKECT